jgi:hypothetical protein
MRAICASGLAQVKTDRLAPSVAVESATDAQILAAQKRADELIAQMTLDEKLQMVHGTGLPGYGEKKGHCAWRCEIGGDGGAVAKAVAQSMQDISWKPTLPCSRPRASLYMPRSLALVLVYIIFSTKNRVPFLQAAKRSL